MSALLLPSTNNNKQSYQQLFILNKCHIIQITMWHAKKMSRWYILFTGMHSLLSIGLDHLKPPWGANSSCNIDIVTLKHKMLSGNFADIHYSYLSPIVKRLCYQLLVLTQWLHTEWHKILNIFVLHKTQITCITNSQSSITHIMPLPSSVTLRTKTDEVQQIIYPIGIRKSIHLYKHFVTGLKISHG